MDAFTAFRDDGALAEVLGRPLQRWGPGPVGVLVAGGLPLAAALAADRGPGGLVGAALAWFVVVGAASAARVHEGRMFWLGGPVLRAVEYSFVVALVGLAQPGALPAAYASVAAAAVHHYETVYRLRFLGVPPPRWVSIAGAGWDGRMILAYFMARAGVLAPALYALASVLAVLFLAESAWMWSRRSAVARRPAAGADLGRC